MKRYLIPLAVLLLAAAGCGQKEDGFSVSGEPYFRVVVRDDSSIPLAELDDMSAQYAMNLGSSAWSSAANAATHTLKAPRFHVNSNLRWKVVSATGEEESWIRPFPDHGEKEGLFFFKTSRNIDPVHTRTAMYNILVDKGSGEYEPLEGMLTVTQEKSALFLEMNAAKFNVETAGKNIKLIITANVPWDYTLTPSVQYGTAGTDWIVPSAEHPADKQVDTLVFAVAANELGIRGADITVNYTIDGVAHSDVIPVTQYPASETELEGFPVKWAVRTPDNTYADTWPSSGIIPPVSGAGLITFHNEAGQAADTGGKVKLDLHDNSPRAMGVWPGDYLEVVASSPVSAGTIVRLAFTTRVSAQGQKYWRLEFRDGEEWKPVGQTYTEPSVLAPDGNPVVYTHAMEADGATNIVVESIATYTANTDQVEFRFICAANAKANGDAPVSAPSGASWRLTVDDGGADDVYQPEISIVAAGAETLTRAALSVTPSYLAFEGSGGGSRKFNVSCNQDFTITPSQDWIHVDVSASEAGDDLSFTVTCDDNATGKLREGSIAVKAGITRGEIAVIQGAVNAGGSGEDLDPFISVTSGNRISVSGSAGSQTVKVLTNVDVRASVSDTWLSVVPVVTKSEVETLTYAVGYTQNPSSTDSRTGTVTFSNAAGTIESVVTITQEPDAEKTPASFPVVWNFPAPSASWVSGTDFYMVPNGHSGSYVYSDNHEGRISVVRPADTDTSVPTYLLKTDISGFNEYMFLHYGMNLDAYWLMEVYDVKNPAGTYGVSFNMVASAAGPKYFMLEYSLDGGSTWTAFGTTTINGVDCSFALSPVKNTANEVCEVSASFSAGAVSDFTTLKVRARVCSAMRENGTSNMAATSGGTNRIFGKPTITFTKD